MSKPLPADKYDQDTLMEYKEWKDAGYCVMKGMKSRCRDAAGACLFSADQVTELKPRTKYSMTNTALEQRMSEQADSQNSSNSGDIHVTALNAARAGRALDAHLESVLFKHHPMAYLDDENEGPHF
jgi:hypothetical protein